MSLFDEVYNLLASMDVCLKNISHINSTES